MTQKEKPADGSFRGRLYRALETTDTPLAKTIAWAIGILILINVIAIIAESHQQVGLAYGPILTAIERVSIFVFSIEYVARTYAAIENPKFANDGRWKATCKYVFSPMALIDLASFAPSLLAQFGILGWDLRYLRTLRLIRLLKLARYFQAFDVFVSVVRSQKANLLGTTFVVLILLIISSSMMYSVEYDPCRKTNDFSSISQTVWWSIVTLTSVGYGDVIPSTVLGKVLGGIIMLLDVGLVALPAAILAGKYADEIQVRREKIGRQARVKSQDGEIDAKELEELIESGQREGFSEEEIAEIAESAGGERGSMKDGRACPNCGYIAAKTTALNSDG